MHARVSLLLATLACAATLPVAALLREPREPVRGPVTPLLQAAPRAADAGSFLVPAPQPVPALALVPPSDATRDTLIDELREALRATCERNAELTAELDARDAYWLTRLERSRIEDDLHQMLELEFPGIAQREDPNSESPVAEQVVDVLLQVADVLALQDAESGNEAANPRPITLPDLRRSVSDATIRQLAGRLVTWNLEQALAPAPAHWTACGPGGGSSGTRLQVVRQQGERVVTLEPIEVLEDDPRIEAAQQAADRVEHRRAEDLELLLGLPAGTLD